MSRVEWSTEPFALVDPEVMPEPANVDIMKMDHGFLASLTAMVKYRVVGYVDSNKHRAESGKVPVR